jgi:signal transduction histidine kinase
MGAFSPNELVEELSTVMNVLALQKGLQLEYSVAPDVPQSLISDRTRLHQILVNLVGNAIKFTSKGKISIHVFRSDIDHWTMEVTDTGPGIPPEAQGFVFEPFRQVDDPIRRRHGGSGLGLSIVKELTRLLGGSITLSSAVGSGTTFKAVFPLVPVRERV